MFSLSRNFGAKTERVVPGADASHIASYPTYVIAEETFSYLTTISVCNEGYTGGVGWGGAGLVVTEGDRIKSRMLFEVYANADTIGNYEGGTLPQPYETVKRTVQTSQGDFGVTWDGFLRIEETFDKLVSQEDFETYATVDPLGFSLTSGTGFTGAASIDEDGTLGPGRLVAFEKFDYPNETSVASQFPQGCTNFSASRAGRGLLNGGNGFSGPWYESHIGVFIKEVPGYQPLLPGEINALYPDLFPSNPSSEIFGTTRQITSGVILYSTRERCKSSFFGLSRNCWIESTTLYAYPVIMRTLNSACFLYNYG